MKVKQINDEVFTSPDKLLKLDRKTIRILKDAGSKTSRRRARINIHENLSDPLHEMFIVHQKDAYIRPHKHALKKESLHVIEGQADIIFFDDKGNLTDVLPMGNYASGKTFFYKLKEPFYHSMLIKSEYLGFTETANGPFKQSDKIDAPWSPSEEDTKAIKQFMLKLALRIKKFKTK